MSLSGRRAMDGSGSRSPYAFPAWGRRLESGGRFELTARVPERAHPGRYRLRKRLRVDRDPRPGYERVAAQEVEPIEVTVEFEVCASMR